MCIHPYTPTHTHTHQYQADLKCFFLRGQKLEDLGKRTGPTDHKSHTYNDLRDWSFRSVSLVLSPSDCYKILKMKRGVSFIKRGHEDLRRL